MQAKLVILTVLLLAAVGCGRKTRPESTWSTMSQYRYDVHVDNDTLADGQMSASLFDFDLRATLVVRPLEVSEERTRLALTFSDVKLATRQQAAVKQRFDRVAEQLAQPQTVTLQHGLLKAQRFPKEAEAVTVGILRNLVSHLQFPTAHPQQRSFEVKEYDATGLYVAAYEDKSAPDESRQTFSRRKRSYDSLTMDERARHQLASRDTPPPKVVRSEGEVVREDGVLASATSSEEIELALMAGRVLLSKTNVELKLRATEAAPHAFDLAAVERSTTELAADKPYVSPTSTINMDDAKIGGRTFDQVISTLEGMAKRDRQTLVASRNGKAAPEEDVKEAQALAAGSLQQFVALAALFRKDPGNVGRAVALVRGGSPAFEAMLSALGSAGTEASQVALIELMQDASVAESARMAAAFSLLRAKSPTPRAAEALQHMLRDPEWRSHAVLGLGTFVRKFGETGDQAANTRFGEVLVGELARSTQPKDRVEVLTGLSNAGFVPALSAIRPYLSDADNDVRAAATHSLRLMQHPEVDGLIVAALRDSEPSEVRAAALEALQNRQYTPALARALGERIHKDGDASLRLRALRLAGSWADEEPALRGAIAAAAKSDESETVRQSAESLLTSLK